MEVVRLLGPALMLRRRRRQIAALTFMALSGTVAETGSCRRQVI